MSTPAQRRSVTTEIVSSLTPLEIPRSLAVDDPPAVRYRLRERMARVYRRGRRTAERLLHPWRRSRALRRVRGLRAVRGVLVVCHGNVCRSPFAAAVLRKLSSVPVTSAGFLEGGRSVPPAAAEAATIWSIDLADHRSQVITRELLDEADLVVVMDTAQASGVLRANPASRGRVVFLGDLDTEPPESRTIIDPWGKPLSAFSRVFERIDRCCRQLARALGS